MALCGTHFLGVLIVEVDPDRNRAIVLLLLLLSL